MRNLFSLAALIVVATGANAAGPVADGKWLLSAVTPTGEVAQLILKVETAEGKSTAALVFQPPPPAGGGNGGGRARRPAPITIRNFKQSGTDVSFEVAQGNAVRSFVGTGS